MGELVKRDRKHLVALAVKAQKGDEKALAELRPAFEDTPEFWGDHTPTAVTDRVLAKLFAGENLLIREATRREADVLRRELAGASPTPLESLLVERAVACWMMAHFVEGQAMKHMVDGCAIREADFWRRSQDSANKRFLAACKTLAVVRRLALPVLQVNVAQQQVNVAGQVNTSAPTKLAR